jgi:hypothetical protein
MKKIEVEKNKKEFVFYRNSTWLKELIAQLQKQREQKQQDHQSGSYNLADEELQNDEVDDSRKNLYDQQQGHETRPLVQC